MEYKVKFTHSVSKIPPRCRKPRFVEETNETTINVKEISITDLKTVFIVREYDGETIIKGYNDKLYKNVMKTSDEGEKRMKLEDFEIGKWLSRGFYGTKTKEEVISEIEERASKYLIVGNEIYQVTDEPRYCIYTFGLGHNHGGTSLSVDYFFKENLPASRYFNALNYKKALKTAKEIAIRRGDTESVKYFDNGPHIEVIKKQYVKCDPSTHGDGNPILNSMENIIEKSSSQGEAALLVTLNSMIN